MDKTQELIKFYNTARLDIKNHGSEDNLLSVIKCSDYNVDIGSPSWYHNPDGKGIVIHSDEGFLDLELLCIHDGELRINIRGVDYKIYNKRVPIYINYNSIKIDGEEVLEKPILASHDEYYVSKMSVKNGQRVKLTFQWNKFSKNINNENNNFDKKIVKISEKIKEQQDIIESQHQLLNIVYSNKFIKANGYLRKLQLNIVEMMKFVDNLCNKYNLTYWLDFGTLIGAVRHDGFVPWDDEADLAMPRKDFIKFSKILPKEINHFQNLENKIEIVHGNIEFAHAKFDNLRYSPVLQIINKNPFAVVEIYPIEYINIKDENNSLNEYVQRFIKEQRNLKRKYLNGECTFEEGIRKGHEKLGIVDEETEYIGYSLDGVSKRPIPISDIFPLKKTKFEMYEFNAPIHPVDYAANHYNGDIMNIPKKIHHHDFESKMKEPSKELDEKYDSSIKFWKEINLKFE